MAQYDAWDATDREEWPAEPEEDDPDIQALLDIGYDQLDAFVSWLEESLGLDTRTAQQDCFNAEALIDYLANHQRRAAADIDEFDLRWFLFNHYIRKAQADAETEERLPDSLRRFYLYLAQVHHYTLPAWMQTTLDEEPFYLARRAAYVALDAGDEREWEEGFRVWCEELEEDLDTRCLWLPRDLGDGLVWGDLMGWREATLQEEANRLWQKERQALVENGLDFESLPARLLDAYYFWLSTPQDRLDGQTPREVILSERQDRDDTE
jgi:hypothetical protein